MMRSTTASLLGGALLVLLAGCKPTTIVTGGPLDEHANADMQVALPPAVKASLVYRCADNSVTHVDYLVDEVSANLRLSQMGSITSLSAPAASNDFSGAGYEFYGNDDQIMLKRPHGPGETCKA